MNNSSDTGRRTYPSKEAERYKDEILDDERNIAEPTSTPQTNNPERYLVIT